MGYHMRMTMSGQLEKGGHVQTWSVYAETDTGVLEDTGIVQFAVQKTAKDKWETTYYFGDQEFSSGKDAVAAYEASLTADKQPD